MHPRPQGRDVGQFINREGESGCIRARRGATTNRPAGSLLLAVHPRPQGRDVTMFDGRWYKPGASAPAGARPEQSAATVASIRCIRARRGANKFIMPINAHHTVHPRPQGRDPSYKPLILLLKEHHVHSTGIWSYKSNLAAC